MTRRNSRENTILRPQHSAFSTPPGGFVAWCRSVANRPLFHHAILGVILTNALLIGLETSQTLSTAYGQLFAWLNTLILAIFVVELTIRLIAEWPTLWRFFRDGWNVFDFTIVAMSLLPEAGPFATVARLARVLRVARLLSAMPELRLIVSTMLRSIPSMGHVIVLLSLLLYIYAIVGYSLFHEHDPAHWGTLATAFLTLFQILTLEGWVELQQTGLAVSPWAWVFYISFIVMAVFVVINLFIAVVINNLEAAKAEDRQETDVQHPQYVLLQQMNELREQLTRVEQSLREPTTQGNDLRPSLNAQTLTDNPTFPKHE